MCVWSDSRVDGLISVSTLLGQGYGIPSSSNTTIIITTTSITTPPTTTTTAAAAAAIVAWYQSTIQAMAQLRLQGQGKRTIALLLTRNGFYNSGYNKSNPKYLLQNNPA